jgi:mannose-6-phosphate isomerase-like protein (cupin superfamily)
VNIRRVVTGQTAEGKSIVVSDDEIPPITATLLGDGGFYPMWGSDEPVKLPHDGTAPATAGWFPPVGGHRFAVIAFGPEGPLPPDVDMGEAVSELAAKVPGLVEVLEPDDPLMHTTDTIDFGFVVSGEIWLELDDGAETLLRPGDCVVQNGTRHAWHNRSSEPCVMVASMVGAAR